jgi:YVTN family beta-propeller protein
MSAQPEDSLDEGMLEELVERGDFELPSDAPSEDLPAVIESGPACIVGAGDTGSEELSYRLIAEVAVGLDPEGVVVHKATGLVYVACSRSNAVAVVDPDGWRVVATIPVGGEPIDIAVDELTGRVFTADARSDQLSVIDAAAGKVVATIGVGSYPAGLCIDPEGRRLYSGDAAGSTMSVVDLDRLERIAVVDAELGAGAIVADTQAGRVYCVNFVSSSLSVVDAQTFEVMARLALPAGPCAVGVHQESGDVFIADSLASTITRVDGRNAVKIAEMVVPNAPVGLIVGARDDRLYVGNRGDGTVSVMGLDGTEWSRIPVGAAPGGVCEDPLHPGRILVANAGSGTLTVAEDLLSGPPGTPVKTERHPMVGTKMPELSLPDLWTEELRDLGEWAGRKYVINVFASW